jgi:hypothetical protein
MSTWSTRTTSGSSSSTPRAGSSPSGETAARATDSSAGLSGPWGVAAEDEGRVYVADYDNGRVQRFLRFGDFRIAWGSGGSGNGQFDNPMGVAIGPFDTVFVTDRGNDRVQKFSLSGAFVDRGGARERATDSSTIPTGSRSTRGLHSRWERSTSPTRATTGSRSSTPRAPSSPSGEATARATGGSGFPRPSRSTRRETST